MDGNLSECNLPVAGCLLPRRNTMCYILIRSAVKAGRFYCIDRIWRILIELHLCYNAGAYMQEIENEVMMIRRFALIFSLLVVLTLTVVKIEAEAVTLTSKPGVVAISSGRLNVRNSASSSGTVISTLNKGSYVTLIEKSGVWWHVEYANGKFGYCHSDYITTVSGSPAAVQTKSSGLNVRSGAGTSYSKIDTLAKGEVVIVLSSSNGWSRILYHGTKTGYVYSQYLSSGYAAVSLWVRNFKQMDERWAQETVGTSGKTFAQIGCATTAIAMVECHRTGKLIFPNEMAMQLNYTSSGSVYWPAHYTVVTQSSGYLNDIYDKLKQGKPILFGATNAYGSQHWVVITGYTGGSTLTASGFTINDPGSNSRTNLQQFLTSYPNFYKYFYY